VNSPRTGRLVAGRVRLARRFILTNGGALSSLIVAGCCEGKQALLFGKKSKIVLSNGVISLG
jgi:hypothetical protein